jgi:hypothetical protein
MPLNPKISAPLFAPLPAPLTALILTPFTARPTFRPIISQPIYALGLALGLALAMMALGMRPSYAADDNNKAASSSVKSGTQATSNALNSVILGNAMGAGGFKIKLGSSPQFSPVPVAQLQDAKIDSIAPANEAIGQGGVAAAPDLSNWSIWATPVFSGFKNNIAPYTSKGDVSIALVGLEYNHNDTIIAGLSYAYSSVDATTTYNGGKLKSVSNTVSPYVVYVLSDRWMLDASMGFGQAKPESNVNGVIGKTSSQSLFSTAGVTNTTEMGKFLLRPRASYTVYKDYLAGYTNSANAFNDSLTSWLYQTKFGGTVSYEAKPISPFVSAHQIFNSWRMTPANTQPSAYASTYQLQMGANASKGIFYGTVAYQLERSTNQFRIYGGVRF